ncbi:MAG TPA: HAMP domain-containing sensor histidine kinase, partial [Thermomicrobiaceae bacterium]|nr:HAMP domain-containing sensor histidine kinase [Thermomicrobiaceae bacterium]
QRLGGRLPLRGPAAMRTLSIRRWLLLSLLALFVVPILLFRLSAPLLGAAPQWFGSEQQSRDLDAAAALLSDPARWRDPGWQQSTRDTLTGLDVGAEIHDPQGNLIFQSGGQPVGGPPWAHSWGSAAGNSREIRVVAGGTPVGTIDLFSTGASWPGSLGGAALAALLGLALTLVTVGWLIGRYVVRPLEATSQAARQIAAGELDFDVPDSRVREVAEMRDAFQAMGAGLRSSLQRQAELEEERRFFVSAIAHDLRTPLFALRGYLLGLERGIAATPEKAAHYVEVCRQKADQLDRLVADLFAYTKVEYLEETLRVGDEEQELGDLLRGVADGLQPRARAREVTLRLDGPAQGCALALDRHLLERAVENLLDNALRHTPSGGTIDISWYPEPGRAVFAVADSGPGIAGHDLQHLFEPLFRGETSRNRATGGAGLGLTIARRILRAHGGDLTAANRPEGGAVFTAWLPCRVEPGARATVADEVRVS